MLVHGEGGVAGVLLAPIDEGEDGRPKVGVEVGIDQDGQVGRRLLGQVAQDVELVEIYEDW